MKYHHLGIPTDSPKDGEIYNKALEGKEVIIKPNSPGKGVTVAFILENGAPVELLEFDEK